MTSDTGPLRIRRVVAGLDASGRPALLADGVPPRTVSAENGFGVSELLWLDAPPSKPDEGGDPDPSLLGAFPARGQIAARVIRFPGHDSATPAEQTWVRVPGDEPDRIGMHRSETLDLMIVLDGNIVLGLDDGEYEIGPAAAVIQQGNVHRWRVIGTRPCTFMTVLISPEVGSAQNVARLDLAPANDKDAFESPPRRLVTAASADGRGVLATTGPPPGVAMGGVSLHDLWQTGGPLLRVDQGGDVENGWALEPLGGGIAFRRVHFAAGHDPKNAGWHATTTIDIDLILSGAVELALPGEAGGHAASTVVERGDVVVMRGVTHRWRPVGPGSATMGSVMISLRSPGPHGRA